MKAKQITTVVAAFQVWDNGRETQTSGFYSISKYGEEGVNDFIEEHYESGTFATLKTYESEEDAWLDFAYFNQML